MGSLEGEGLWGESLPRWESLPPLWESLPPRWDSFGGSLDGSLDAEADWAWTSRLPVGEDPPKGDKGVTLGRRSVAWSGVGDLELDRLSEGRSD